MDGVGSCLTFFVFVNPKGAQVSCKRILVQMYCFYIKNFHIINNVLMSIFLSLSIYQFIPDILIFGRHVCTQPCFHHRYYHVVLLTILLPVQIIASNPRRHAVCEWNLLKYSLTSPCIFRSFRYGKRSHSFMKIPL